MTNFCVEQHFGEMAIQRLHRKKFYSKGAERIMNKDEFGRTLNIALEYINMVAPPEIIDLLFSEIDLDNDGWKDIFISNGIYKDLLDRDYLTYMANEERIKDMIQNDKQVMNKLVDLMPSQAVPNAVFKNNGNFEFIPCSDIWGLDTPSFSNGSAYGDIDNDGDLDLVVNNVNMSAFIYENNLDTLSNRSITVHLKGGTNNTFAIGAKVEIYYNGNYGILENFPSRGFQSSISPNLLFGTGTSKTIDSLIISWPNNAKTKIEQLETNKTYNFKQPTDTEFQGSNNLVERTTYLNFLKPKYDILKFPTLIG